MGVSDMKKVNEAGKNGDFQDPAFHGDDFGRRFDDKMRMENGNQHFPFILLAKIFLSSGPERFRSFSTDQGRHF